MNGGLKKNFTPVFQDRVYFYSFIKIVHIWVKTHNEYLGNENLQIE